VEGLSGPTVRGVGLDLVDLARFGEVVARRPGVLGRIFTDDELRAVAGVGGGGSFDRVSRQAALFAAKEAVMKSIGVGLDRVPLHDIVVCEDGTSGPGIELVGAAADRAGSLGVRDVAVTITRTGGVVSAMAISSGPDGAGSAARGRVRRPVS